MKKEWFKGAWLRWLAHPLTIFKYIRDVLTGRYTAYSRGKLIVAILVIVYILLPFDFLHDWVAGFGWIDDAAIAVWALSSLDYELTRYNEYRKALKEGEAN